MKRALLICLAATPLFALTPLTKGNRIGVLRSAENFAYGAEQTVARNIGSDLRSELASRGFHAFDAQATLQDLQRGGAAPADYYIEIVSSNAAQHPVGAVAAGVGPAVVDVGIVVARVAAEMRLYDGRTLALLDRYDLRKTSTSIVPTSLGLGTRSLWGYFMLPFVQRQQYRAAAHEVAAQAADRIARR